MKKSINVFILCVATITIILTGTVEAKTTFKDLKGNEWFMEALDCVVDNGIMNGYLDGEFKANNTLTYDQFVKCVVLAYEFEPVSSDDMIKEYWADGYMKRAYIESIIKEYDTNNIEKYTKPITRGEMAEIIVNALNSFNSRIDTYYVDQSFENLYSLAEKKYSDGYLYEEILKYNISNNNYFSIDPIEYGQKILLPPKSELLKYKNYDISYSLRDKVKIQSKIKDFGSVVERQRESVVICYDLGIITGYTDGTFGANNILTRAEATAVIARLKDTSRRKPADISDVNIGDNGDTTGTGIYINEKTNVPMNDGVRQLDGTIFAVPDLEFEALMNSADADKYVRGPWDRVENGKIYFHRYVIIDGMEKVEGTRFLPTQLNNEVNRVVYETIRILVNYAKENGGFFDVWSTDDYRMQIKYYETYEYAHRISPKEGRMMMDLYPSNESFEVVIYYDRWVELEQPDQKEPTCYDWDIKDLYGDRDVDIYEYLEYSTKFFVDKEMTAEEFYAKYPVQHEKITNGIEIMCKSVYGNEQGQRFADFMISERIKSRYDVKNYTIDLVEKRVEFGNCEICFKFNTETIKAGSVTTTSKPEVIK